MYGILCAGVQYATLVQKEAIIVATQLWSKKVAKHAIW